MIGTTAGRAIARPFVLVLPIVVVAAGAGVAQSGAGHRALRSIGLISSPSAAVQLAFTDPTRLASDGPAHQTVRFEARRLAGTTQPQPWRIAADTPAGRSTSLATGSLVVGSDAWARTAQRVDIPCGVLKSRQVHVEVSLGGSSIGYWTTCGGTS